ncbi:benzoate 4-monooxygenase cytochrome P450 [Thozetella sp. PMI_491]|nr:benzoate 4-monooxygenase cytochrome P450 [Thozetella sp. PMI_491]
MIATDTINITSWSWETTRDAWDQVPLPIWATISLLAFINVLGICIYRLTLHPLARFPGPPLAACTSFYYMYYIWTGYFPQHCEALFAKYDTIVLRVSPNQIIFNDPQALKDLVGRSDVYKGHFALRVIGFAGNNVSTVNDPAEHRRKRRILAPGFSNSVLAEQEPLIIGPLTDKLVEKVHDAPNGVVNLSSLFDCATTDIIGALSFGANFGMLDQLEKHPFLHVLPDVLRWSVIVQCIPEWFQCMTWINHRGPKWAVPKPMRGVVDFAKYHMDERKKRDAVETAEDKTGHRDIMSVIEVGNEKFRGTPGYQPLNQYELLGEATTLVAGGGDTVATALTTIMFHLGQNPEIMEKLCKEVRQTFETFDAIDSHTVGQKIPYLDAVANEAMRVTPVLPGAMWRRADHPLVVCGHPVPAGTDAGAMRWCIFRNPKCFHDPTSFNPQRWIDDNGDNLDACIPFGIGPRTCIGRNIAWMELRLIVSKLLWSFDWTPITKELNNPDYLVMYRGPMLMRATARPA